MVEDVITGLSHIQWLFVIARNSSFAYKGRAVDAEIRSVVTSPVRYILEGSVRKVRGTASASQASSSRRRTVASFGPNDTTATSPTTFALQDEIAASVVGCDRAQPAPSRNRTRQTQSARQC